MDKPQHRPYNLIPRPVMQDGESFCTKCRQVKPIEAFAKNKRMPNGVHAWCKTCIYEYNTKPYDIKHYRKRRDSQALYARRRSNSKLDGPINIVFQYYEESRAAMNAQQNARQQEPTAGQPRQEARG